MQTKYSLLDERDIGLVHQYTFEAKIEIEKNGNGTKIFAERERHCGGIAPVFTVVHRNCVTVDNRLENLVLVPQPLAGRWCSHTTHSATSHQYKDFPESHLDSSLYWMAIQQIPYDPADEVSKKANLTGFINPSFSLETALL